MEYQPEQIESPFKESLVTEENAASPVFRRLCNGLYRVLSEMNVPDDTSEVPSLTPAKMATYYRLVGEDFDTTFLDTAPESLAYIYQMLGCYYSLQPTGLSAHRPPTVPALLPSGFLRWQLVQILLCPAVHAKCLQRAVQKFSIIDPVTTRPFPSNLPDEVLPSEPDQAMTAWHQLQLKRLHDDVIMEADGASEQKSPSATITPPPRYTTEKDRSLLEREEDNTRHARRNRDTYSCRRYRNSEHTRHASYMSEKQKSAAGREYLNRRHTEGSERECQYRLSDTWIKYSQQQYPCLPMFNYATNTREGYEQGVPSDNDDEVVGAWARKLGKGNPVKVAAPPPETEPTTTRGNIFNRYRLWTCGAVPTSSYRNASSHSKARIHECCRSTPSSYSFPSRGVVRRTMEEADYARYSRPRGSRSVDDTDYNDNDNVDEDEDEDEDEDREEADYFGFKKGKSNRKQYSSPTLPYPGYGRGGRPVRPRYHWTQTSTAFTSTEDDLPQQQRHNYRARNGVPRSTYPACDEVGDSSSSDGPDISPDILRRTKNGSPHPNIEKILNEAKTPSVIELGQDQDQLSCDDTEAEIDREHERIARKLRTKIIKRLAMNV